VQQPEKIPVFARITKKEKGSVMIQKNWQELIKPSKIEIEHGTNVRCIGKVVAEPLERGFGLTLGNALRRILLSSLQGAAVTAVQIDGVLHEFSSIDGVREDVTDIILNIKALAVRTHAEGPKRMRLFAEGPCEVTAGMIEAGADIEIMNPDLVICNMEPFVNLEMEISIDKGRGYVQADENKPKDAQIGLIAIDSIFTPIKNVKYTIEDFRVEQKTDYEKLIIELQTDGSIHPENALKEAANILIQHFILFSDENIFLDSQVKKPA